VYLSPLTAPTFDVLHEILELLSASMNAIAALQYPVSSAGDAVTRFPSEKQYETLFTKDEKQGFWRMA
jgi:hypothetical protein